jgi:hypothetical protein
LEHPIGHWLAVAEMHQWISPEAWIRTSSIRTGGFCEKDHLASFVRRRGWLPYDFRLGPTGNRCIHR